MDKPEIVYSTRRTAIIVIILFCLISLFGEMVSKSRMNSEWAYLSALDAPVNSYANITGYGILLLIALYVVVGITLDKTRKHWRFIFAGCGMLALAPLLGIITYRPAILAIMIISNLSLALRNPVLDKIFSYAADNAGGKIGFGFVFGIQGALNRFASLLSAILLALSFFIIKFLNSNNKFAVYQTVFKLLFIPIILMMIVIIVVYRIAHKEKFLDVKDTPDADEEKIKPEFWTYAAFIFISSIGFTPLTHIMYYFRDNANIAKDGLSFYSNFALVVYGIFEIPIGMVYDYIKRKTGNKLSGFSMLMFIPIASVVIPFLTLGGSNILFIVGLILYGVLQAARGIIMRSSIADLTPLQKRGTGYGVYYAVTGITDGFGPFFLMLIWDNFGIPVMQIVIVAVQALAMALFFRMRMQMKINMAAPQ